VAPRRSRRCHCSRRPHIDCGTPPSRFHHAALSPGELARAFARASPVWLLETGHEAIPAGQRPAPLLRLAERFGAVARYGDATELLVLERAGVDGPT
jgi:hypothetical protein